MDEIVIRDVTIPIMATAIGFTFFMLWLAIVSVNAAYRNGITDGYGYAVEPHNPGYAKAGEYLKKNMAHRWPEVLEIKVHPRAYR